MTDEKKVSDIFSQGETGEQKTSSVFDAAEADLNTPSAASSFPMDDNPQSTRQWAMDQILGLGKGYVKGAVNFGDAPYRLLTGAKPMPVMQPKTEAEGLGSGGFTLSSYLFPAGAEAKGAEMLSGATKAWPSIARYFTNVLGKAGIGAGSNAAIAYANNQDPAEAAKIGGSIAGGAAALGPVGNAVGSHMKDWARVSLLRALDPGTLSEKAAASEVADELLKNRWVWFSKKGLQKRGQRAVNDLMQQRVPIEDAAKARFPNQIPTVPSSQALPEFYDASMKEFQSGRDAAGSPMGNTWSDDEAHQAYLDYMDKYVNKKVKQGPQGGYLEIPELLKNKAATQAQVANKGGFLEGMPKDPITSARDKAAKLFSIADKRLTDAVMGDDWKNINEAIHNYITIRDLGRDLGLKSVGEVTPFAERLFTGFGMQLRPGVATQVPGIAVRGARQITGKPWWNSSVAQLKDVVANRLTGEAPQGGRLIRALTPNTEKSAALASFIGSDGQPQVDTTHINESPVQGQKVTLPDPLGIR